MRSRSMPVTLLALVAMASTARATTMLPLDLPALTARAEDVVSGRVTKQRAAWTDDHEAIYTDVTIVVDRVLAGSARIGQALVVRREGGSVDGIGMKVHGAATFADDEDVVVFLEHRGVSRYVVGMAQGKLHLYSDASGGGKRLQRDLSEVAYTQAPSDAQRRLSTRAIDGKPAAPIASLDELAVEVTRLRKQSRP